MVETKTERKKLAIIDGKSVFYRGYYAMPNLSTKDGTPTGGVYGFCAMALELIKRYKPDYVCVAWDKPKTNIRKRLAIYPDYKAGRKPAPPDFYAQIPILHEVLEAFNWPLYEYDDYEADDIMCSLSKKASSEGIETMLISSDLDMLQCLGPLTHMYALKKGLTNIERFDPESFEEKYGVRVEQFLDLKALKGDGSDNIPGVPGVGEKGAAELLRQYDTLDGVYENVALVKGALAKKLEAGKDSAYMSREVARLFDDAPVPLDLEQMDVNKLDTAQLASILKRLEFRSLLQNLPEGMRASNTEQIAPASSTHELHVPAVVHVTDAKGVASIKLEGDVVLHARSAGKHGEKPTILLLADSETCYAIDLRKISDIKPQISTIIPTAVIGYDLKNSLKVLLELGVETLPRVSHDCLVGAFIVNSLRRDQSLSEQASNDLGYEVELENLDDDELLSKAGEVVAVIRELANLQGEQMSEVTSLIKLAEEVDWPVIPVLARLERAGMKLDPPFFAELSEQLADQISDVEQTIYGHADQEFNISSPSQLSEVLFVKLGLPVNVTKKGKAGHYSTASNVLVKLKDAHPIIACIEQYREYTKLKSTYVDPLPTMVDAKHRVHSTMNLTIAATGRLSSIDPNLQNIPVRTELGRKIREGFVAEKGNMIISADYSQFELRIAAAMAQDEAMIASFNEDRDIHTETAALIQGVPPEEVTKEMRYAAKAVNFGILYGQGVHGLSEGTGISYAEAKQFIDKYFEVRPKLKGMIERFRAEAKDRGYVETVMGRRRPTPDVQSSNFAIREGAYRAAINMPIQGSAADLTKMAMVKLQAQFEEKWKTEKEIGDRPQQIMQIHDSIMVECKEADAEAVSAMMKETMEQVYPSLGVNLRVDVSVGKNWGEL
ncbi:MAG TPA: DNA polymerase I [Candidatus Saccharibacteria bacterium]|jgi:DNA polymerase-1|nr:DNA polymerase I [Candidatus Saccharibacteria bacterium]